MRTLDALVAERVMGWVWWDNSKGDWKGEDDVTFWTFWDDRLSVYQNGSEYPTLHFSPSTDIAAAFVAESKVGETEEGRRAYTFALCEFLKVEDATIYYDATDWMTFDAYWMMIHATPEQRCIAMLLAVGVTQDEIDAAMKQEDGR